jgi:hypothetical protein
MTMATEKIKRQVGESPDGAALVEIHRRLVAIHHPLAVAGGIDPDLHRRTLQRLSGLLEYVDDALTVEERNAPS